MLPNFLGAAGTLVLLSLLVPLYGSMGVGVAIVLASAASLIISAVLTKRYLGMTLSLTSFVKSAAMSGGLWVLAGALKQAINNKQSNGEALVILCGVGIYFSVCQYYLLYPSLKDEVFFKKNSK
jgi:peptidoglycan biosynthesis protein MviN/MurJ (putative lipid II flippase)